MGVYVVHHHEGTRLRYQVMDVILGHFAKEEQDYSYTRNESPTNLDRIAGRYQWTTHCHTCETGYKPQIHTLELNGDGTYSIFGRTFYQVEPLLYHSTDGERTMGFVKDSEGNIAYMSTGGINMFKKVE